MSETTTIPDEVVLAGIGYRVGVSEGLVTFAAEDFYPSRISFLRDDVAEGAARGALWYVELRGNIPVDHILAAYEWVRRVYGGAHEWKRPTSNAEAGRGE